MKKSIALLSFILISFSSPGQIQKHSIKDSASPDSKLKNNKIKTNASKYSKSSLANKPIISDTSAKYQNNGKASEKIILNKNRTKTAEMNKYLNVHLK